ncbi:MAG: DUF6198 family protein [Eubacteriales bacterium]
MQKKTFYTEAAYIIGIAILALGTALMATADFGVSMVVAPAYLIYLKVSGVWSFFTFGMAEYALQAVLLVVMMLVLRRFRVSYLFSFVTVIIYGLLLDASMAAVSLIPLDSIVTRLIMYPLGFLSSTAGVSLLFHTYLSPAVYEMFVKQVSGKYKVDIHKFKTVFDITSFVAAIVLSLAFFGLWHFEGIKAGTIVCTFINGWTISRFSHLFEKHWEFKDALKLRGYFQ